MKAIAHNFPEKVLSLLVCSCFFGAMFSRAVFDYSLFAVSLMVVLFAATNKLGVTWQNIFLKTGFNWVWGLWLLSILASFWANELFELSKFQDIFEFRWILGMFFLARALEILKPKSETIENCFILAGAICLYFIFDFLRNPGIPGFYLYPNRLLGHFRNPNDYAHAFLIVASFGMGFFLFGERAHTVRRYFFRVSLLLVFLSVFLTYSRIVWFSLLVVFFICLFRVLNLRRFLLSVLIGAIVLFLGYRLDLAGVRARTDSTFGVQERSFSDGRVYIWKGNWEIFTRNPLFGVGYQRNVELLPAYYAELGVPKSAEVTHAHNQYLQWLATGGVVGLCAYLLVFLCFFYKGIEKIRALGWKGQEAQQISSVLVALVGFLIAGLADSNLDIFNALPFLIFIFSMGIYLLGRSRVCHVCGSLN